MSIEQMRVAVSSVYTGDLWKEIVDGMHETQVVALYNSFLSRGLIGTVVEYKPPTGKDRLVELPEDSFKEMDEAIRKRDEAFMQLSIDDI